LFRIVSKITDYAKEYREVLRWHNRIIQIALILKPAKNKTGKSVEKRLKQYLNETEEKINKEQDKPFITNLMNYSKGFWKGLFVCYDHPLIPRTNNDLELFFREIKRDHRRITGLRSWNRYIMRHGENVVLTAEAIKDKNIQLRINSVKYETYKNVKQQWKNRTLEHTKHLRFKKDPEIFLTNLEERWVNSKLC
jgi:hypothetical protein